MRLQCGTEVDWPHSNAVACTLTHAEFLLLQSKNTDEKLAAYARLTGPQFAALFQKSNYARAKKLRWLGRRYRALDMLPLTRGVTIHRCCAALKQKTPQAIAEALLGE